jgi:ferredoxin
MNKLADFYYFSGTGNTRLIAGHAVKILGAYGVRASLKPIEKGYAQDGLASELWFAFPANSQAVSPFIWKFFKSLPYGDGKRVFVIVTLNKSVHVLPPLRSLLERKGYVPVSACEISTPNNMADSDFRGDEGRQLLDVACEKAYQFVRDAMEGVFAWKQEYAGSKFVAFLSRETTLPWLTMRLMFKLRASPSGCTGCGACAAQCPAGNIRIENQMPVHGHQCQFCMRCAAYCQNKAIKVPGKDGVRFRHAQNYRTAERE